MIRSKTVTMLGAVVLLLGLFSADACGSDETYDWKKMIRMCEEARTIHRKLVSAEKADRKGIAREALEDLEESGWDRRARKSPGGAYLRFWKAGLNVVAGQPAEYLKEATALAHHPSIAVDVWRGVRECAKDEKVDVQIKDQIARLLPVYDFPGAPELFEHHGYEVRRRRYERYQAIGPEILTVQEVAANLAERVYWRPEPIRDARLRHVYSSRYSEVICPWMSKQWDPPQERKEKEVRGLSDPGWYPVRLPWLRLAELEWRIGGRRQAANYLAKTLVAGTDMHVRRGKILIQQWRRSGAPPAEGKTSSDDGFQLKLTVDPETAVELAEMYRKMDLDPLAVRLCENLISIAGANPGTGGGKIDIEELEEKYMQQWIEKCEQDRKQSGREKYRLWGQPANTEKQIRQITVPPPLQEEVVEKTAKQLPEIIKRIQKTAQQK